MNNAPHRLESVRRISSVGGVSTARIALAGHIVYQCRPSNEHFDAFFNAGNWNTLGIDRRVTDQ